MINMRRGHGDNLEERGYKAKIVADKVESR